MERKWQLKQKNSPPADLLNAVDQNMTVAAYLMQRGITTSTQATHYLQPDRKNLSDPYELPDMDRAVDRIEKALLAQENIGIWGDFDADGQTATAVLVECLTKLGADVQYYLPVRGRESHGISIPSLQIFIQKGIQLLITCDTGISEHDAIRFAIENHLDVIITDHHTLPEELPPALACINPRRLAEDHPLGSLSGSGAAFELILAVCRKFNREEVAFESIDLAAIGLIADLAPLKNDSRLLAQLGLEKLSTQPRICIKSLLEAAGMPLRSMDEQTIGFILAPRLNAAGRLEDANPLVSFLLDREPEKIPAMAARLESINANRKWLCDQVYHAALDQLDRQTEWNNDSIIILSNPTWPGGVLGLVAGQLTSEFNKPAIILNESADGILRGSARSIEGINITEAIKSTAPLLTTFGGHPMAAGLSLSKENLPAFRREINQWLRNQGIIVKEPPPLDIDAEITIPQITSKFYAAIKKLAPFGNENPPMLFCLRRVQITSTRPLGRNKEHFKFIVQDDEGNLLPAVWWNTDEDQIPSGRFDIAFSLNENEYKGETTLQAEWIDHHLVEEAEIQPIGNGKLQISDFRTSPEPLATAMKVFANQPYLIFQEPPVLDDPVSVGRNHLHSTETLILASIPPSRKLFENIIQKSQCRHLVLAFENPADGSLQGFLRHLSGLIRFAITDRNGLANLNDLAEAMNSNEEIVLAGIQWLKTGGKISIASSDEKLFAFDSKSQAADQKLQKENENLLRFLLSEAKSYSRYTYSLPMESFQSYFK